MKHRSASLDSMAAFHGGGWDEERVWSVPPSESLGLRGAAAKAVDQSTAPLPEDPFDECATHIFRVSHDQPTMLLGIPDAALVAHDEDVTLSLEIPRASSHHSGPGDEDAPILVSIDETPTTVYAAGAITRASEIRIMTVTG